MTTEEQPASVERLPPPLPLTQEEQPGQQQPASRMNEPSSPSIEATAVPSQANLVAGAPATLSPPVMHTPSLPGPTILPPLPVSSPFGVRPPSMLSMSLGSMPGTPAAIGPFTDSGILTPGLTVNAPSIQPVSPRPRPLTIT